MQVANITASVTVAKIKPTNFSAPRSAIVIPCLYPRVSLCGIQGSECVSRKLVPDGDSTATAREIFAETSDRVPSRHEGGGEQREGRLAALVNAAVARLQDAPFGPLLRRARRFGLAGKGDGVPRQHRLDPAQIAKTRRRAPHRDLLAARGHLLCQTLAVGDQKLHADRADVR